MTKIYVYADFNWLKKVELVGELSMQSIRGKESYSFEFSKDWLKNYGSIQKRKCCSNHHP